jgi:hypothetical protein
MSDKINDSVKLDKKFTMSLCYADEHDIPDILTKKDIQGLRDIHVETGLSTGRIVQGLIKKYLQKAYYHEKGSYHHLYKDFA